MTSSTRSRTFRRLWYKGGRRWSGQVPFLLAERARSECARSMRAVKGSLTTSYQRGEERIRRASPGLVARLGVPVGGRVKKLRAVRDSPGHLFGKETSWVKAMDQSLSDEQRRVRKVRRFTIGVSLVMIIICNAIVLVALWASGIN